MNTDNIYVVEVDQPWEVAHYVVWAMDEEDAIEIMEAHLKVTGGLTDRTRITADLADFQGKICEVTSRYEGI